jgi:hypothetical protein
MTHLSVKNNKFLSFPGIVGLALLVLGQHATAQSPAPVPLASAANFAVLAATQVTSTGKTVIYGDLGVDTGDIVTGSPTVLGNTDLDNPIAAQAQYDLGVAYNNAMGRSGATTVSGNIGGPVPFIPGIYFSASSLAVSSGNLILDAQGNTNGVWIFQIGSTLTTTTGQQVILTNGAQASNVFWQVGSSATIGTTCIFKGTIMAYTTITLGTGAVIEGRALAVNGEVDMAGNSVSNGLPMVLSFGPIIRAVDGAVTMIITNTPNFPLTLQISVDLVNWTNLTVLTPNATPYSYTDTSPSGQAVRFYRAHY